jgi:CDP-diacylglycerol--glycerol-3-phosphate 3-phosphatidyltransferase
VLTVADRITLARVAIAPLAVAGYLLAPAEHMLCFWICGCLCGAAELTDWLDGRVARQRGEVSDFGKLADPFCDVLYRLAVFLAFLLPAGGVGYRFDPSVLPAWTHWLLPPAHFDRDAAGAPVAAYACVPWLPVFLMALREIVAGAIRAMAASRGLVLAARTSGKVKAMLQCAAIVLVSALPALTFAWNPWYLVATGVLAWICAVASVGSILEYIWINRAVLRRLGRNG